MLASTQAETADPWAEALAEQASSPAAAPAAPAAAPAPGPSRPAVAAELRQVSREMPDACERLEYVGKMTARAANTVLGIVDVAKPECDRMEARGDELAEVMRRQAETPDLTIEKARLMLKLCAEHMKGSADFARQHNARLTDIMMAQDFQDLSGQVINKVTDILLRAEAELRHIVEDELTGTEDVETATSGHQLEGVQVPDRAMQQDDVDDLLASLGF